MDCVSSHFISVAYAKLGSAFGCRVEIDVYLTVDRTVSRICAQIECQHVRSVSPTEVAPVQSLDRSVIGEHYAEGINAHSFGVRHGVQERLHRLESYATARMFHGHLDRIGRTHTIDGYKPAPFS